MNVFVKSTCFIAFSLSVAVAAAGGSTGEPPVFARYRPMRAADWNWTAWSAGRFIPFSGPMDGADPADVATEIALASAAGLDGFLMEFDVKEGLPLKREVVDQGFLNATNRSAVKIAALYTGESTEGLETLATYVAEHWAGAPEYWKIDGKAVVVTSGGADGSLGNADGADDSQTTPTVGSASFANRQRCLRWKSLQTSEGSPADTVVLVSLESFIRVPVAGDDFEQRLAATVTQPSRWGELSERAAVAGEPPAPWCPVLVESWNFSPPESDEALFPSMRWLAHNLHVCRRALSGRGRPTREENASDRLPMVGMWSFWNRSSPHARFFDYPAPDITLSYGPNWRQTIDLWLPEVAGGPLPIAVCIHGGGWNSGNPYGAVEENIRKCHARGIALATVSYRLIQDATQDGVSPPVRYPLEDALAAVRFLKAHAAELGIDSSRIMLFGGSAGACSSLYVSLQDDCEIGIKTIFADVPQTSMDPAEVVAWIPNMSYGGHAFGYRDFRSFLAERDKWIEWIDRYSPAALARRCTPAKAPAIFYRMNPLPPEGQLPKDTAHAGMFCVKFQEVCDACGVSFRPGTLEKALDELVK